MAARNGIGKAVPGTLLLVVHDFHARSNDELSLAKGDRVELVERYGQPTTAKEQHVESAS